MTGTLPDPIRVGLVGLSAARGWAATAHVPALRAVGGVELVGGCASSPESSARAAAAHGLERSFATSEELVASDAVDLVVITVKVAQHHELVSAALAAGKAVLCEWPLGNGSAEADDLAARAGSAGALNVVGLQVTAAPVIRHLRDVVARGDIGEVLSTTMIASGGAWGPVVSPADYYHLDPAEGATLLSIPFGHTLAGVEFVLGPLREVGARTATRRHTAHGSADGIDRPRLTHDQLLVDAGFASGAVGSFHYRGGMSRGTNFHWEINGSDGDIVVSGLNGHLQMAKVDVAIAPRGADALRPLPTPASYEHVSGIDRLDSAYVVAHAYERLVRQVRSGEKLLPDFADGAAHHHVLDRVAEAATTGRRIEVPNPA